MNHLRLALGMLLAAPIVASGQAFPARSLKLVVPFPPGGASDTAGRLIAQKLSEGLRQPVVIENRAGVAGIIGTEAVVKSPADGYTLLLAVEALTVNPFLYKKLPYETPKDFTPLSLTTRDPNGVAVHASLPVKSLSELIAYARKNPGKLNLGTSNRMSAELFKEATGLDAMIILYKGAALAMNDLLGGQVQVSVSSLPAVTPHASSERIRLIAVTDSVRYRTLPDVPTVAETIPGYEGAGWTAIVGPAGMAPALVSRLNTEIVKAVRSPENQPKFETGGQIPVGSSPEELADWIRKGLEKWRRVTQAAGIQPE